MGLGYEVLCSIKGPAPKTEGEEGIKEGFLAILIDLPPSLSPAENMLQTRKKSTKQNKNSKFCKTEWDLLHEGSGLQKI